MSIFHPSKGLPKTMTAARLQRYAMFLAGHQYKIVYRNTRHHSNAEGLSRLPLDLQEGPDWGEEAVEVFYTSVIEPLPVTAAQICDGTRRDPLLAQALQLVQQGWPDTCPSAELKPFYQRRAELTTAMECLLWGNRVIIPPSQRQAVMEELHEGHPGIVCMKSLARSHIWWPGMDAELEQKVKACQGCQQTQPLPATAPLHPWIWPAKPFQRVHIDFLGPFRGHMWLVLVDSHSKWPEVLQFQSTTANATVNSLRTVFARYGCPDTIVSDNGPQFVAAEFEEFLEANGIRHHFSAPYHPATNGLAERFVQSFKRAINAFPVSVPAQEAADKFLLAYRNTVHPTTGDTPAKLFLGRQLRTRLDLLRPDCTAKVSREQANQQQQHDRSNKLREFTPGDDVLVQDYRHGNKSCWTPGIVSARTGPLSYVVTTAQGGSWRRHVDQMRHGHDSFTITEGDEVAPKGSDSRPEAEATPPSQQNETSADQATEVAQPVPKPTPRPLLRRSARAHKPSSMMDL